MLMALDHIIQQIRSFLPEDGVGRNLLHHIKSEFHRAPGSKALYICLPSWGGKLRYFRHIRKYALQSGHSLLTYAFPSGILSSNIPFTRKCFDIIRRKVCADLRALQKRHGFTSLCLIGFSLGTAHACMISSKIHIDKLILIVPGHSLADPVWEGIGTRDIRRALESRGVSLDTLRKQWLLLAPEHNIRNLKRTKIDVYLTPSDKVVPYVYGKRLVSSMRRLGLRPNVKTYRLLGHYGTILRFCWFPKMLFR